MSTPFISDSLLVSSPNNGGITLISNQTATILERSDTTGIWLTQSALFRNAISLASNSKEMQLQLITETDQLVFAQDDGYDFHDVLIHDNELYLVSTGTNEVIVFNLDGSRVRAYAFPGGNDSWHINCLGVWENKVVLSAFGEFDAYRGYKNNTLSQGFVLDLVSGKKIWEGLSQPHTPVQYQNKHYICNSEEMQVLAKDKSSTKTRCVQLDGYTRGIAFSGNYMYVGLSQSRNSRNINPCGQGRIVAIDIRTFEICGRQFLPFPEIYDIRVVKDITILPSIFNLSSINALQKQSIEYANLLVEFNNMRSQFQRINDHLILGKIIRLMRWIKQDSSFGNPDPESGV